MLELGGRGMGFSPCRPPRSSPPDDPSAEADGCLRLRLSGCDHPVTEAVSRGVFTNPSKLQPAVKLMLFR